MANVLITGCSSGFGLLNALEFARKGDRVFATMRNTGKAAELEQARAVNRLPIDILRLDLLDQASITAAVREAEKAGPIDVLVNNAGIELRAPIEGPPKTKCGVSSTRISSGRSASSAR